MAELQLEKYFKLFQEKLEDAERIATEIRAQVKKFFTILHEKSHQLKDHLPTNLTMLTEVSKQLQTRVQLLQEKMEELQTKANKAYQDGQEIVLKNMEAQLEMVREQLKAAKEQTKVGVFELFMSRLLYMKRLAVNRHSPMYDYPIYWRSVNSKYIRSSPTYPPPS